MRTLDTQPLVRTEVPDPLAICVNVVYDECKSQEKYGQWEKEDNFGGLNPW